MELFRDSFSAVCDVFLDSFCAVCDVFLDSLSGVCDVLATASKLVVPGEIGNRDFAMSTFVHSMFVL